MAEVFKFASEHPVLAAVATGLVGYATASAVKGKQVAVAEEALVECERKLAEIRKATNQKRRKSRRSLIQDGKLLHEHGQEPCRALRLTGSAGCC